MNPLFGYVQDMDITAMRDTITPLDANGTLAMNIEANENEISGIRYEVYSLDGEDKYTEREADVPAAGEQVTLDLGNILSDEMREAARQKALKQHKEGGQS